MRVRISIGGEGKSFVYYSETEQTIQRMSIGTEATRHDQLVRRDVANVLNGLTEHLWLERKRVPGRVLSDADRLECLFFGGFDPHFDGDEPPGL